MEGCVGCLKSWRQRKYALDEGRASEPRGRPRPTTDFLPRVHALSGRVLQSRRPWTPLSTGPMVCSFVTAGAIVGGAPPNLRRSTNSDDQHGTAGLLIAIPPMARIMGVVRHELIDRISGNVPKARLLSVVPVDTSGERKVARWSVRRS